VNKSASEIFEKARQDLAASIPDSTGWWWVRSYHDGQMSVIRVQICGPDVVATCWPFSVIDTSIMSSSDCVDFVASRHPGRGTLDQPPHRFTRLLQSYPGDRLSMAVQSDDGAVGLDPDGRHSALKPDRYFARRKRLPYDDFEKASGHCCAPSPSQ
jgi:hypothetical protein